MFLSTARQKMSICRLVVIMIIVSEYFIKGHRLSSVMAIFYLATLTYISKSNMLKELFSIQSERDMKLHSHFINK